MLTSLVRRYLLVVALVFAAIAAAPAEAQAPRAWTQAGILKCMLNPSMGFIIVGHQSMECKFEPAEGYPQAYEGAINTVGLDSGATTGGALAWAVFAPTKGGPAGALAGEYVGASGNIDIGVGGGANVLMGGSSRTFDLQPLSVEGSVGLNIALGVSMLKLRVA